ncbi:erythromycin esterase family protein [Maribellus maritimus]|uniref:erythromycin esterase family protein n=1 Tax=Maribellus maritimus TaxID=2870838 RepID=UPI001EEA30F3|nr:erythromycin esterase family protein [Maribellus maritimus]MCG6185904.1 erythromycin esterase family protein [Maribellus maritimus]
MNKILTFIIALSFCSCNAQTDFNSTIEFSSDLENFENILALKEALQSVEIIALGENTHGLGEVFKAKTELVKFLHQELGFDLVLFESGYGDGALAWERLDSLSTKEFTNVFSSNFYYHSEEIESLVGYAKSQNGKLKIQGFDCQPQQNYLIKRMSEVVLPVDPIFSKKVSLEMRSFNNLYQYENGKDTLAFYNQRDRFIGFISEYDKLLDKNTSELLQYGTTKSEINALKKSNEIFVSTYSKVNFGEMMSWPTSANIRDKASFEIVKWFKENNPKSKIIIWAQNSHIENKTKPNYNVNWMGHNLKKTFGDKYYSIGAIVYSGKNLNNNGTFDFEHNDSEYFAYHLNQFQKEKFVFDLRKHNKQDFTNQLLLGMESNGNTAEFIAKDRFDGLLFIKYSDIPTLIRKE